MALRSDASRAERRAHHNKRGLAKVIAGIGLAIGGLCALDLTIGKAAHHYEATVAKPALQRAVAAKHTPQPVQALGIAPQQVDSLPEITRAAATQKDEPAWRTAAHSVEEAVNSPIGLLGGGLSFAFTVLAGIGRLSGRTVREAPAYVEDEPGFWDCTPETAARDQIERIQTILDWQEAKQAVVDERITNAQVDTILATMEARRQSPLNIIHAKVLGELGVDPRMALTYSV